MEIEKLVPLNDGNMVKLKTELTNTDKKQDAAMMALACFLVGKNPKDVENFSDVGLKQLVYEMNEIVVINTDKALLLASSYRNYVSPKNEWLGRRLSTITDTAEEFNDLLAIHKYFSKDFIDSVNEHMDTFKLVNALLNKCIKITE